MDAPVREGEILAGKYRVERVLGAGGMGVVVAAHHLALDRRVAIKFLLSEAVQNPEVLARFAREARAAVKIESEHVARVIDVGALDSGAPYMVMEYLVGSDLAHRVDDKGPLPVEEAVDYVLQACEAIAEAHAAGIIHRDLKPANLFLTRRADGSNFVKVLDFGISKATATGAEPEMQLTKTSAVLGSPLYMAPEQMRSTRKVDMRVDIWALGVILYELLSGKVPFEATTMTELCALVLMEQHPPLRDRRPEVPPGLAAVIDRCLQKKPDDRFPNISELANALVHFAPSRSRVSVERISRVLRPAGMDTLSVAPPAEGAVDASSGRLGESTAAAMSTTQRTRGTNKIAIVGAVVGLCAIGGLALALVSTRAPSPSPSAEPPPPVTPAAQPPATQAAAPVVTPEAPAVLPEAPSATPPPAASSAALVASAPAARRAAAPAAKRETPAATPAAAPPPAPAPKKNPLNVGLK